jgi:hypothetical protein
MNPLNPLSPIDYLAVFHPGERIWELRAISKGGGVLVGHYDNPEIFAAYVKHFSGRYNLYSPINRLRDGLPIFGLNSPPTSGCAVGNGHIAAYSWLVAEIDPKRFSATGEALVGVCATTEEKIAAREVAHSCQAYFRELNVEPAIIDSGNGYYVLAPCDLPCETGEDGENPAKLLIAQAMKALAAKFDSKGAEVDITAQNESRILRVPGALNIKGENTEERPHRYCQIVAPGSREVLLSHEVIVSLAQEAPIEFYPTDTAAREVRRGGLVASANLGPEWVDNFLDGHDVGHKPRTPYQGGWRWILDACPFEENHTTDSSGTEAAIIQRADGKLGFVCHHAHCHEIQWSQFRSAVEGS